MKMFSFTSPIVGRVRLKARSRKAAAEQFSMMIVGSASGPRYAATGAPVRTAVASRESEKQRADIIGLRVHVLKEKLETFGELFRGNRNIEGRRNDRDFRDGDYLLIREYDDIRNTYSGRREIRRIGAIRRDFELGGAIAEGFVLLHLEYVELGVREVIDGHYDVVFAA